MSNPKRGPRPSVSRAGASAGPSGRTYWLYGLHAARAALANPRRRLHRLVITAAALEKLADGLEGRGIKPQIVSAQEISHLLKEDAVHQGVAMEVAMLPELSLDEYIRREGVEKPLILLDQVTDPHNIGAILRSAAAFGAGAVVLPKDHAPQESAVLAKASSGGIELVPMITVTNLAQTMEALKKHGYWCVGLDGEAKQTIGEAKLSRQTALVLGAEGRGLRRLTAERADLLVRLPIEAQMESLNVSNAAAIALYVIAAGA